MASGRTGPGEALEGERREKLVMRHLPYQSPTFSEGLPMGL
jgi:hypothetical protein